MTEARTAPEAIVLGGRYRLDGELGRGGMAIVHRAHDLVLGRDVAVKVFRPDVQAAGDPRRVQAEMRLLASVNSPALVTLHDASAGEHGSPSYLVMELVDGEDLGRLSALPVPDTIEIGRQIADGLAHVHSRGIVHRDVKPANVLVARTGGRVVAKLADLGIARLVDSTRMTAVGTIIGTAAYLSPEQVLGERPTPASDVYSLGLLLLETLTGQPCYPGTRAESLTARTTRPPRLPGGLHSADEALLRSMTAIDPADRPTAAAVAAELGRWRSPGPFRVADAMPDAVPDAVPYAGVTADLDATQMGLPPTRILPLPGTALETPATALEAPATALGGTAELRVTPSGPSRGTSRLRPLLLAAGAILAAGTIAAAAFLARPAAPEAPAPSPTYPAVGGELGASLNELQESVQP